MRRIAPAPGVRAAMLAAATALLLAACGRKEPVDPESLRAVADSLPEPRAAEPAGLPDSGIAIPAGTRTRFACDSGEELTIAWFVEDDHALLTRGPQTLRLERQPAETGLRFAAGTLAIAGDGEAFTFSDGIRDARCVAVRTDQPAPEAAAAGEAGPDGAPAAAAGAPATGPAPARPAGADGPPADAPAPAPAPAGG